MHKTIVELLKDAGESFLSGEEIAQKLGVSRAAIWKHINKLRNSGYQIISRERCGYKLENAPDLLLTSEVQSNLNTQIIGKNMHYFPSIDSTNKMAKVLAYRGAPDGTVVIAEEQTGGKGRLERSFFSPRGGIWFSIILRPNFLPADAPKSTLMTAVAVSNAMLRFNLKPQIKWPNDILFDNRKLVGILTELSGELSKITYIVVGIGINVNIAHSDFPEELQNVAASLSEVAGHPIKRVKFFQAVLEEFDKLYLEVNKHGFAEILNLWRKFNVTLGHKVKVIPAGSGDSFTGLAQDIADDGSLIVSTQHGLEKVVAGDVSIRYQKAAKYL